MYIIIAILIFGLLIATHELGHFTVAKLCGVKVTEFAVGMGPALWKKEKGETLYALRLLPIGGYCAMEEDEESEDPRAFTNQAWWKRMLILVAGAAMNFITGFIILLFIVQGSGAFMTPAITGFFEGCPYEGEMGLMEGDEFYKIDGQRVYFSSNISFLLGRGAKADYESFNKALEEKISYEDFLADKSDEIRYDLVLIRNGEKVKLNDYKLSQLEYEIDGKTEMKYGLYFGVKEEGVFANAKYAFNASKDFVRMVWLGLSDLVTGAVGLKELSGPVGIVELISDVGEASETRVDAAYSISYLAAFIAINLAVMNMLPIPALDGGRILLLLITAAVEGVSKKKLNPKYEGYIHAAGLVLLLGLMAFVMINDVYKLFV